MRNSLLSFALIAGLFLPMGVIYAQDTSTVTATCKDGTAFTGTKRSGACRGHGGVQSGSIPPARSITAPVTVGMARPNTAVTCPRRRPKRRAPGRTTGKLAPRKAAEALVEDTNAARGRCTLRARGRTGEAHRDIWGLHQECPEMWPVW